MQKKILVIVIIIIAVVVIALGGVFAYQYFTKPQTAGLPVQSQQATEGWKTYKNGEYGFEIKYPKDWYYKEFAPTPDNITFKTYNPLTKEYKDVYVTELTDYVIAFGVSNVLKPRAFGGGGGGDGFITIKIFNGTMEDLFNRKITRSGVLNYLISVGKTSIKDIRKDFWGEKIIIDGIESFKVISRGYIPDALTDFPIEVVHIEKDGKVIDIIMENVDNNLEINNIYKNIFSTFKFTK